MTVRPVHSTRRALEAMARGPYVALVGTATIFVAVFATGLFAGALGGAERLLAAWAGEVRISVYLAPGRRPRGGARRRRARSRPGARCEAVPAAVGAPRGSRTTLGEEAQRARGRRARARCRTRSRSTAPGISLAGARALAARLRARPRRGGGGLRQRLARDARALRRARAKRPRSCCSRALALATAVLVSNTLRLAVFARRDEIEIMKLVGATDAFVAAPFLIEGLLQGLLGAGARGARAPRRCTRSLVPRLAAAVAVAGGLCARATRSRPRSLAALVAGGAAVGLLGSALSVARTLRRTWGWPWLRRARSSPPLALAAGSPRAQLDALEARRRAEETAARHAGGSRSARSSTRSARPRRRSREARAEWRRVEAERAAAEAALARRAPGRRRRRRRRMHGAARRAAAAARSRARGSGRAGELPAPPREPLARGPREAPLPARPDPLARPRAARRRRRRRSPSASARAPARQARRRGSPRSRGGRATGARRAEARREERETLLAALRSARGLPRARRGARRGSQARAARGVRRDAPAAAAGARGRAGSRRARARLPLPAPGTDHGRVRPGGEPEVQHRHGAERASTSRRRPARRCARSRPGAWCTPGGSRGTATSSSWTTARVITPSSPTSPRCSTAMGEEVDAGAVLGTVGDSGSLKGPYLYFEIRERGRPVDPRPWLGRSGPSRLGGHQAFRSW